MVNTLTCLVAGVVTFSILGNIALLTHSNIESVVSSGPGLVFITYPQVVLQLPGAPIWAILFFVMLLVSYFLFYIHCYRFLITSQSESIMALFDRRTLHLNYVNWLR